MIIISKGHMVWKSYCADWVKNNHTSLDHLCEARIPLYNSKNEKQSY